MFILRFDMKPATGEWIMPETHNTNTAAVIMEPDTEVEVDITVAKDCLEGSWAFSLRDSKNIFAMAAEDQ